MWSLIFELTLFFEFFVDFFSGNELGDSVEDIQDLMAEIGKIDCLGPFDENEDLDSDNDDESVEDSDTEDVRSEKNDLDDLSLIHI